ncbi:ATP-binding protein [Variovorax sp. PCZ-1]|uniref:sensor histidine kinase n=1 Tax=Variovorax sp. PCZ-1 TaxID=2835533 RepID=UPI001BCBE08B|nr:ATP-binding protein [Variovorax sp. PCZ-1]MBS7806773.1 hypothetical protein [Variovorax sp. PCZ-1]
MTLVTRAIVAFLVSFVALLFTSHVFAQSTVSSTLPYASEARPIKLPLEVMQADLKVTVFANDAGPTQTHSLGIQQLPWRWDRVFVRQRGVMHVKLDFPLDAESVKQLQEKGKGLGLAAANIGNRHRLRINGGQWQSTGWDKKNSQNRQKPSWYLLPAKDLRSGGNVIELEIQAEPANEAGLSVIEIGHSEQSLKKHSGEVITLYSVFAVIVSLSFWVSGIAIALALLTREKFYAVAASAECCFFLRQLGWLVEYPILPTWVFNALQLSLHVFYAGLMFWISQILIDKPLPWLERLLKTYLFLCIPIVTLGMYLGDYRFYPVALPAAMLIISIICATRLVYYAWMKKDWILYAYAFGGVLSIVAGSSDFVHDNSQSGFGSHALTNYAFATLSITMFFLVAYRYLSTRDALHELNMARNLEAELATNRERERLMQDIHDAVGSQLVGLLSLVNNSAPMKQIKSHTERALGEMRLAIDAINTTDGDLSLVLASLRHRLQPQLSAAQLDITWQVDAARKLGKMSYSDIQHIQRIILEVFSNIMQHARAKKVVLTAQSDVSDDMCWICISDDGVGFNSSQTKGRGISNMHKRAEILGAILTIEQNKPSGTIVKLGFLADS